MSTLPNSPMMLDSTGQAMVTKLESIRLAILNGGGGGGGGSVKPATYDASIARHGNYLAYIYGDYCTYEDVAYRCIAYSISANAQNPPAFDSTKWQAVENIYDEIASKPGMMADNDKMAEVFGNITNNVSSGYQSHAEGNNTQATNSQAHSEGNGTQATGYQAHAEGNNTKATGSQSHAEGNSTEATANEGSHAEGYYSKATASAAHAEGNYTEASGYGAHAEGNYSKATAYQSHAEGSRTEANGSSSHAEGSYCVTTSNAESAHAEGNYTEASGYYSHAEGSNTKAKGSASHAEGYYCEAIKDYSHAGGQYSKARSQSSFASGYYVETDAYYSAAFGMYNKPVADGYNYSWYYENKSDGYAVGDRVRVSGDTTNSIYECHTAIAGPPGTFDPSKWNVVGTYNASNPTIFSIGNGTSSERKNTVDIRKDGTIYLNGNELPKPPTTDGTYTLQCTVSNGTVTYSWV